MKLPVLDDAKALLILLQVIYHGGEIESRELRKKIVEIQHAMTSSTFWRKLQFLEWKGFLGREARIKRNKAVAYIVVVEPSIKFIRVYGPGPTARLLGDWVKRTINPQIPSAEEEVYVEADRHG